MVKVIYIVGFGRSGSTLLDIVLGSHPALEGGGELTNLVQGGWINNDYCACGVRGNDCPFWSTVRREWTARTGIRDLESYAKLQEHFTNSKQWAHLKREQRGPGAQFQDFARQTVALYETMLQVGGKSAIVDSSKSPVRALALSMMPEIDLRLIHLVRDPRGVAWSLKKPILKKDGIARGRNPYPVWKAALKWQEINARSEWVCHQLAPERVLQARYEDLMENPRKVLEDIGKTVDLDLSAVAMSFAAGETLPVHHPIAGNRMRMAGGVKLRPDTEWMEKLSPLERWTVCALTGWKDNSASARPLPNVAGAPREAEMQ